MNNKNDYSSSFSSPGQWRPTTRSHPCPICKRFGDCNFSADGAVMMCRKVEQGAFKSDADKNGRYFYLHRLDAIASSDSLPPAVPAANVQIADADILHSVYSAMLAGLGLSAAHRSNLQNRGLNDSEIDHRAYRTLPKEGRARIARELHNRFGDSIMRVPGLCTKDGERGRYLSITGANGMLIPVRDVVGRIVALRVRKDEGEPRYSWMTSVKYAGAGPGAPAHVPKGINAPCNVVRLTEGELKADVAFSWSNVPTISVAGVGVWRPAVAILKSLGCDVVRLAFDADASTNKDVARALDTCAVGLIAEGFTVEMERWDSRFKGIDDALSAGSTIEVVEAAAARQAIAEVVTAATGDPDPAINRGDAYEGEHESPEPEEEYLPNWVEFPIESLPPIIANFATDYGIALAVHPACLALFALTTIAAAVGTSRVIRMNQTWTEPPNVFANLICEPSTRKSAALQAAIEPAEQWNAEKLKEFRVAQAVYDEEMEQYSVWVNESAKGNVTSKFRRPTQPSKRRLIAKDITVETFIRELSNNPRGLFLPLDELRLWFASFGKYSKSGAGSDECFWLSVFNARSFDYDRKTGEHTSIHIEHLMASICGGIQPKVWRALACEAMFNSGMVGRILLMWPPKVRYTGYVAPRESTTRHYHQLVKAVLNLDYEGTLNSEWRPVEMRLTNDATELWEPWLQKWRDRQYESEGDVAALLGKLEAYCCRFALIFAVCDRAFGSLNLAEVVEIDHVRSAIALVEWFAEEAERIYLHGKMSATDADRVEMLQKIRERGGSITPREVWAGNRQKWKGTPQARAFLNSMAPKDGSGPLMRNERGRYFLKKK